jgi:ATP-dependent Lhr-like helicase
MGTLPEPFAGWFADRGWTPRPHQMALVEAAEAGRSALLVAPTGGGKTLAGFLPSLIELARDPRPEGSGALHTLYVSPLKALAVDIARNLDAPVSEMGLPIRIETRTGDTPQNRRARQRAAPPNLLLTTPESLALLLSQAEARTTFGRLGAVVVDEIHALAGTKRGDQLALCLSRLGTLAPEVRRVGLSATVAHPDPLRAFLSPSGTPGDVQLVQVRGGAAPELSIMLPEGHLPWGGHMGLASMPEVYRRIREAGVTIVFVNTRAQSELCFQALWRLNDDNLPIALHHGSLTVEQRRKVEAAMASGKLRAVVATASLDLGIDWGSVDQVVQVGRPRAWRGCCNGSAAPTTAWTSLPAPCWCRRTASRWWSASPRWKRCATRSWTATRRAPAAWTCWRSTSWPPPATRRSIRTTSTPKWCGPGLTPACRAGTSTTRSASWKTAATRCGTTNGGAGCSATPRAWSTCATPGRRGSSG